MNRYEIRCTNEQTLKALKLGAPIECYVESDGVRFPKENPTAEQMISWLEEQGMFIEINSHRPFRLCADWRKAIYTFSVVDKFMVIHKHNGYNDAIHFPSRKEATLAAIDAALDYLKTNEIV